MRPYYISLAFVVAASLTPLPAFAQSESTLIETAIPQTFDRGRNVSVTDRERPDYDPLGIRQGGFLIFPQLDLGLGATDNVFQTNVDRRSDGYLLVAPSIRANSDWSRDQLSFSAGGRLRRYFTEDAHNQNEFYANGLGRVDILDAYSITAEAQVARTQEEPFAENADASISALSSYYRYYGNVRGEYREGRLRGVLAYDFTKFNFNPIELTDGTQTDQSNRDRGIQRVSGQGEYALTPSTSLYTQLSYSRTDYDQPLAPGVRNRDSDAVRLIGGANIDWSGFLRGSIGIGYVWRDYDAPIYRNVSGVSVEAMLQYFAGDLTTFTLNLRRVIEDSTLGNTSAFFDNRISLRADHELLRNLIANATVEYGIQDYIDSSAQSRVVRVRAGGRYLVSRTLAIQTDSSYGHREQSGTIFDGSLNELRGEISIVLRR